MEFLLRNGRNLVCLSKILMPVFSQNLRRIIGSVREPQQHDTKARAQIFEVKSSRTPLLVLLIGLSNWQPKKLELLEPQAAPKSVACSVQSSLR